jgi:hypothetical protein
MRRIVTRYVCNSCRRDVEGGKHYTDYLGVDWRLCDECVEAGYSLAIERLPHSRLLVVRVVGPAGE